MKPIFIFRHLECEGPGYLEQVLARYDLPFSIICIDQNDEVPKDISGCSGLVFMGGPMSVNDDLPWIAPELELIRQAVSEDMPVFGHCLGGQLICKALGGTVGANPVKEIGWLPVTKLPNPSGNKWLSQVPQTFTAFHWHGETFSIPDGATTLLESQHCHHQAFSIGNTLALQCHVEMTADMVNEWATLYADELLEPSNTVQSKQEIMNEVEKKVGDLQRVADQLYLSWLQPLMRDQSSH